MKKYFLLVLIALVGCTKTIDKDKLQVRNDGKAYEINSDKPYSGKAELIEDGFQKSIEEYENGYKNGECNYYYSKDIKESEKNYKNGKLYGLFKSWYKNGQLKFEASYAPNEKLIGKYVGYYDNGQKEFALEVDTNKQFSAVNWWDVNGNQQSPKYLFHLDAPLVNKILGCKNYTRDDIMSTFGEASYDGIFDQRNQTMGLLYFNQPEPKKPQENISFGFIKIPSEKEYNVIKIEYASDSLNMVVFETYLKQYFESEGIIDYPYGFECRSTSNYQYVIFKKKDGSCSLSIAFHGK